MSITQYTPRNETMMIGSEANLICVICDIDICTCDWHQRFTICPSCMFQGIYFTQWLLGDAALHMPDGFDDVGWMVKLAEKGWVHEHMTDQPIRLADEHVSRDIKRGIAIAEGRESRQYVPHLPSEFQEQFERDVERMRNMSTGVD